MIAKKVGSDGGIGEKNWAWWLDWPKITAWWIDCYERNDGVIIQKLRLEGVIGTFSRQGPQGHDLPPPTSSIAFYDFTHFQRKTVGFCNRFYRDVEWRLPHVPKSDFWLWFYKKVYETKISLHEWVFWEIRSSKELFFGWGKIEPRRDSSEILNFLEIWASTMRFLCT